jgi:transposase
MAKVRKYKVTLSEEQRERLRVITRNGHAGAKEILHAQVLLLADEEHPEGRWKDKEITKMLGVHRNTISRIRRRFVEQGEAPALRRKVRAAPPTPPKLDGAKEAQLIAICCSPPPEGRVRWTLNLLVDELKARKVVVQVCAETVRKALKKISYDPGKSSATASPKETTPAS